MQIQLTESRFGVGPREIREGKDPTGREEALLKAQVWCGEDDLGSRERRLVGQEDTKRVSERKHAEIS
jgi:hypothetical protein